MSILWAGITLGLVTGLHCVGMCGPLVLALPGRNLSPIRRWGNRLNYHLGRSFVYAALGSIAGSIGQGIELFTWQRSVAIAGGTLMVIFALVPRITHRISVPAPLRKPIDEARTSLFRSLEKNRLSTWLGLGALNGMLPCGPLYVGLAGALATGTWAGGAVFMFLFGMGTAVALSALQVIRDRVLPNSKNFSKVLMYTTAIVGILLVLRGLDLGIPFLSPSHTIVMGTAAGCH